MTKLHSELAQFIGTTAYHLISPIAPKVLATDGVEYVCTRMKAFWLFDVIASHLMLTIKTPIQLAQVTVDVKKDHTCHVTISESRYDQAAQREVEVNLAYQEIDYTDLPEGNLSFLVGVQQIQDQNFYIVMLTSEY